MSSSGREALPDIRKWWEALTDVQKWSEDPPGCPGVVGRPFGMARNGSETTPDVREWSGDPPGCL